MSMALGSEETTPRIQNLRPRVELFRTGRNIQTEVPLRFIEQSRAVFEGIYPQDPIRRMQKEGYNPVMIGYDHPLDYADLPGIKGQLLQLREGNPGKTLKVAHEIIPPVQLQWIKDFLEVVEEYKTKGTMRGKVPDHTPEDPEAYKAKLRSNHAENLSLWMLENGFQVSPLDSPDVKKWMTDDKEITYGDTRESLTAIRRDIYGLGVMDRERPDIITTGNAHALKYDILLGRDGSNSRYYMERVGDWNDILSLWQDAHKLYRDPNALTDNSQRNHRPSFSRNIFEEDDY